MSTLKTNYHYKNNDGTVTEHHKEVELDIIKQYSLQEIRMVCVINFMMPIDPIINDGTVRPESFINPKRIKLEYEQVSSLFVSKTIFYQTIKKLIERGFIKRDGRNIYSVSKEYFPLAEDGGTTIGIFGPYDNYHADNCHDM